MEAADKRPVCPVCGRHPDDISEYAFHAHDLEISADEYVERFEGTYNPRNEHFYCTSCYIKIGMPLGKAK